MGIDKQGSDLVEDELFKFADDDIPGEKITESDSWKVLVVDDEEDIHHITGIVLNNITYKSRPVKMLSAYSLKEAATLCNKENDIALILLDVVMEVPDAGLKFVKIMRDQIGDKMVRIILRTGQPGQVPEREVVEKYDINDYKTKTELTSEKLTTTVISALRNYDLLRELDDYNQNLENKVREKTGELEVLLNDTLKGSIKTLVDILSLVNPFAFSRAERMLRMAKNIGHLFSKEKMWEIEMAVLLSQIGCITVPDEVLKKAISGKPLSPTEKKVYESFPKVSASLIKHIPRLERISRAIERQLIFDPEQGDFGTDDIETILYILNKVDIKVQKGVVPADAFRGVTANLKIIDEALKNTFYRELKTIDEDYQVYRVPLNDIILGSVVVEDIMSVDGRLLVTKGHIVSEMLKIRLKNWMLINGDIIEPVKIAVKE